MFDRLRQGFTHALREASRQALQDFYDRQDDALDVYSTDDDAQQIPYHLTERAA